jgi:hypothetical protein
MEFDSEIYVEIGEEINRKTYSKIIWLNLFWRNRIEFVLRIRQFLAEKICNLIVEIYLQIWRISTVKLVFRTEEFVKNFVIKSKINFVVRTNFVNRRKSGIWQKNILHFVNFGVISFEL